MDNEALDLKGMWLDSLGKKATVYPRHTTRASQIGHPCVRYLVYDRTRWQDKLAPSPDLMAIFHLGNEIEAVVLRILERLGFRILEAQRSMFWKDLNISGHIEGKYIRDGWEKSRLFEIKSMSPTSYDKVNSCRDLLESDLSWIRKYPAQILTYLLLLGEPSADLICFNKVNGQIKSIEITLDDHLEYAEGFLKRAEEIERHVKAGSTPDRLVMSDGSPADECERCDYGHICLPGGGYYEALVAIDNDRLENLLDELDSLSEQIKVAKSINDEKDKIRERIKNVVKDKPKVICGKWVITGKWTKAKTPSWRWTAKKT